jgi:hypothetical protein
LKFQRRGIVEAYPRLMASEWSTNEVVAYTEHDGPGRPPGGSPTWIWYTTAATLGVVFSTILFTDSLCPEHRAWVQGLASGAIVGVILSITGLLRAWAAAPALTILSAALGTSIGLIDMAHSPVRGGVVAGLFALAALAGIWLAVREAPVRRWEKHLRHPTTAPPVDDPVTGHQSAAVPPASAPAANSAPASDALAEDARPASH